MQCKERRQAVEPALSALLVACHDRLVVSALHGGTSPQLESCQHHLLVLWLCPNYSICLPSFFFCDIKITIPTLLVYCERV